MKEINWMKGNTQQPLSPIQESQNQDFIKRLLAHMPDVGEVRVLSGGAVKGVVPEEGEIVCMAPVPQSSISILDDDGIMAWETVYDAAYASIRDGNHNAENYKLWNSAISGAAIPAEEMYAWQQGTVTRIKALKRRSILEIGCGQGLLLFPLLAGAEQYVGTDISCEALDWLQQGISGLACEEKKKVSLRHSEAGATFYREGESFDLVIYNSVVQYFPRQEYLQRSLKQIMPHMRENALIFLGDIRNFTLAHLEQLAKLLHHSPFLKATDAWAKIRQGVYDESELLFSPGYWHNLPGLFEQFKFVATLPKAGDYENELSMFRYDVILQLHNSDNCIYCPSCLGWNIGPISCGQSLDNYLANWKEQREVRPDRAFALTSVPNALLSALRLTLEGLESAAPGLELATIKGKADVKLTENPSLRGLTPSELRETARRHGLEVALSIPPAQSDTLDAVFFVPSEVEFSPPLEISFPQIQMEFKKALLSRQANRPMQENSSQDLQGVVQALLDKKQVDGKFTAVVLHRDPGSLETATDLDVLTLEAGLILAGGPMFSRPKPGLEATLAGVWAKLAKCDLVSAQDSYLIFPKQELVLIHSWLEEALGECIPAKLIHYFPGISALAAALPPLKEVYTGDMPDFLHPGSRVFPFIPL